MNNDRLTWLNDAPDDVRDLAINWPLLWMLNLPPASTIVAAGAFRGKAMDTIGYAYPDYARLVGFEPQDEARRAASARLSETGRGFELYGFALGEKTGTFPMGEYGAEYAGFLNLEAGASRTGQTAQGEGEMREVIEAFDSLGLQRIDLLFLNVEGYEYILLPLLAGAGFFDTGRIRRLVMQMHPGLPANAERVAGMETAIRTVEQKNKRVYDALPNWGMWQWSYE